MQFLAVRFGALFTEVREGLWEAVDARGPCGSWDKAITFAFFTH